VAQTGLGDVFLEKGQKNEAVTHFRKALELRPDDAMGHYNLGNLFARNGLFADAIEQLEQTVKLQPSNAMAHNNLGTVLYRQGRADDAITQFTETAALMKNDKNGPKVRCNLALLLEERGRTKEAAQQFEKVLAVAPDLELARSHLRGIAWSLATSPEASARDGSRALELARELVAFPGGETSDNLGALAAAEAESGQYGPAATTVQRALDLAASHPASPDLIAKLQVQLADYQSGTPFREAKQTNAPSPAVSR
jgi:tetratricopeptide (TPR) repeat protein